MPDLATAPPTAEVLRERDTTPTTDLTPDTPKSDKPLSLLDIAQRSEDAYADLKAQMPKFQAQMEAQQAQAGAASQLAEQAHQQLVQPAIARMVQASRAPLPEVPKALPQPAVPDIRPRPFMDVKGKDALGGVVQTLGLMAQMAMAGKAPVGALNALTGAMNGWAEGDHERAQREWRQYLVTVDNIRQENQDNMQRWEASMKTHGANQTAAQAEYIGMLAEQKHYDAIAQVAREGMPSAWQQLQAVQAEADKVRKQTMDLIHMKQNDEIKRLMLESAAEGRREALDLRRESMMQAVEGRREALEERRREHAENFREKVREFNERQTEKKEADAGLTPEAIQLAGEKYAQTGIMPQMGWGSKARIPIANAAAEIMKQRGMSGTDWVDSTAMYAGLTMELKKLTTQRGPLLAFAAQGHDHLKVALGLVDKVDTTGVPVLTRWLRAGQQSVAGDPDVTTFNNEVTLAVNEVARVTQSATGSGVATDTARREARELINTAQNPEQFKAAATSLNRALDFRAKELDERIQITRDQIKELGQPAGEKKSAGGPGAKPPQPGMIRVKRKSDGATGWLNPRDLGELYEIMQ